MKPWIFYLIVAWNEPLTPLIESQKTIIFQFQGESECNNIAQQVQEQINQTKGALRVKQIGCHKCEAVYDKERCRKK
jgi:hypothetical protein